MRPECRIKENCYTTNKRLLYSPTLNDVINRWCFFEGEPLRNASVALVLKVHYANNNNSTQNNFSCDRYNRLWRMCSLAEQLLSQLSFLYFSVCATWYKWHEQWCSFLGSFLESSINMKTFLLVDTLKDFPAFSKSTFAGVQLSSTLNTVSSLVLSVIEPVNV